jgi:hypothetical protein
MRRARTAASVQKLAPVIREPAHLAERGREQLRELVIGRDFVRGAAENCRCRAAKSRVLE